jgi:lipooligosaccharide transport system permease protein
VFITTRFFPTGAIGRSRAHKVLERNVIVYRRGWTIIVSGFFEPLFYLLGIGFGLGALVGDVGDIPYAAFVAPGLMATAAMNGAIFESTFNVFFKLKYAKTYDAIVATPMAIGDVAVGEVGWSLIRGGLYAAGFLVVMVLLGLARSPLAILAVPGALLVGFAFAAVGMAVTTWMRTWQDFDLVFVIILPLFLFSATFYPLSAYPEPIATIVGLTPLFQGVDLLRQLTTGAIEPTFVVRIAYLVAMGVAGLAVVSSRLDRLLLK